MSAFAANELPVSGTDATPRESWLTGSNGSPASSARNSRSLPGLALAITSRSSGAGGLLRFMQPRDALGGKVQELIELVAAERMTLGGSLHLDEPAARIHHDVHVGLGVGILGVIEIEDRDSPIDADGNGGDLSMQGTRIEHALSQQHIHRVRQRDESAGDRRSARAAVRLEHVAVEREIGRAH